MRKTKVVCMRREGGIRTNARVGRNSGFRVFNDEMFRVSSITVKNSTKDLKPPPCDGAEPLPPEEEKMARYRACDSSESPWVEPGGKRDETMRTKRWYGSRPAFRV